MIRAMCGICGVIQVAGRPRPVLPAEVLDRMTDAMTHRGPDDRGYTSRPARIRRAASEHRRRRRRPPALLRTRTGPLWAAQNGELYNHARLRRASDDGPSLPEPVRHRDHPAPLRGARARVPDAPARHVRARGLGRTPPARRPRPRPARASSPSTTRASAIWWSSPRSSRACSRAGSSSRASTRRGRRVPHPRLRSRPATAARRRSQALARARPGVDEAGRLRGALLVVSRARGRGRTSAWTTSPAPARRARRLRSDAADVRRPTWCDAERRTRLQPDRRAHGPAHDRARQDVLRGIRRGPRAQRARRRPGGRHAFGTEHHELELSFVDQTSTRRPRLAPRRAAGRPLGARLHRPVRARRGDT